MGKNELPLARPSLCDRLTTDGTATRRYGNGQDDVRQK
jgi:hypothetical protein